ncbi:iron chelate uptake ABC transporter family permease subunit [Neisseria leonii]|uniref:Iron chelate uptake ABC transporter family permease subunit n=1 Tax=Neisseria leonii TaxID=2995413 RepID=A0A9X4IBI2_9NEIS|nr:MULTISPECIES: iron chelate uptake ABC transporter family permease subunit [unclassified Neisseria]MDD9326101.1 iron chelate uptake ABC transporter family permease subunit [Neisseria sp. 3986]MDD9328450.1 iron chelate uptake ABC transporter family permease subunit [Neisseria sp. 51.81]
MPSEYTRPVLLAAVLLAVSCTLFMTLNAGGNWAFVLPLRAAKLAALLMVAYAAGVSTLLFQTLTNNPVLTPSLLGFESLYVFLQTLLVVVLGGAGYTHLPPLGKFGFELAAMIGGSLLLFRILLKQGGRDLARVILIGVIFGVLFRSLSSLLQRLIDPEEFAVAQAYTFASFNSINREMLGIGSLMVLLTALFVWRERHRLDVLLLGRDQAVNLGISYARHALLILVCVSVLVSVSVAVVGPFGGPVSFFGLLAVALANWFSRTVSHSIRLPMVFLTAALLLVAGQTLFEHVLGMKAVLSVVVEFAGGLVFLWLVLKKRQAV